MQAKDIYKKQQGKDPYLSASEEEHGLPIYIESRSLHYIKWLENFVEKNAQQQDAKERAENVSQQSKAGSEDSTQISVLLDKIYVEVSATSGDSRILNLVRAAQKLLPC